MLTKSPLKLALLFLLLFAGGAGFVLFGQTPRTLKGKVVDDNGESVPGAFVFVKGTQNGTMTDADGNYELPNVTEGVTIAASFIGFDDFEAVLGKQGTLNIVLKIGSEQLEEVVLVAYGAQKKVSVTGSIESMMGVFLWSPEVLTR